MGQQQQIHLFKISMQAQRSRECTFRLQSGKLAVDRAIVSCMASLRGDHKKSKSGTMYVLVLNNYF